jgi:hypothetical protein
MERIMLVLFASIVVLAALSTITAAIFTITIPRSRPTRTLMTESSAANTAPRPSSAPILLSARMVCGKKSQAIVPQSSRKADPIDVRCQRRSFSPKKGENWGSAGMLPDFYLERGLSRLMRSTSERLSNFDQS